MSALEPLRACGVHAGMRRGLAFDTCRPKNDSFPPLVCCIPYSCPISLAIDMLMLMSRSGDGTEPYLRLVPCVVPLLLLYFCLVLHEISTILDTGLDRKTLSLLLELTESGVNPEALAAVVKELRREAATLGAHR